ncbi:hypothetical protein LCGC14_1518880 [marine sediment metagenome]|uniref:Uncharacterized protein n=1 Tax=marine sediment metagenome TaxID=412755 RepID=A0A0F9LET4_9ZZZZ
MDKFKIGAEVEIIWEYCGQTIKFKGEIIDGPKYMERFENAMWKVHVPIIARVWRYEYQIKLIKKPLTVIQWKTNFFRLMDI